MHLMWNLKVFCFTACNKALQDSWMLVLEHDIIWTWQILRYLLSLKFTDAKRTFLLACKHSPTCVSWLGVGIACYRVRYALHSCVQTRQLDVFVGLSIVHQCLVASHSLFCGSDQPRISVLPGLVRHHRHQTHSYFTEISFFVLNRILTKSPTQRTSGSEQTQQERTSGNMSWSARDVVDRERIALFFNKACFPQY